jgi:hypothetical protein
VKCFSAVAPDLGNSCDVSRAGRKTGQPLAKVGPAATITKQELTMAQTLFSLVFNRKTLIRVAFAAISLAGVAHAQSASKTDAASTSTNRPEPVLQGGNYMEGGGG